MLAFALPSGQEQTSIALDLRRRGGAPIIAAFAPPKMSNRPSNILAIATAADGDR
jgi:hypothetical protein